MPGCFDNRRVVDIVRLHLEMLFWHPCILERAIFAAQYATWLFERSSTERAGMGAGRSVWQRGHRAARAAQRTRVSYGTGRTAILHRHT